MQRILFLAVCLVAMATAQAQQFVPMYSEVYNEKTGALESKEWQSAAGHSRLEYPDGSVTIFRLDSMAMYWLDPAKKTARAMPFSTLADPNKMVGRVVQTNHSEKREVVERGVDVEGYLCDHITVTIVNTAPDGSQSGGVEHMWEHEPLKTWIRYGSGQFTHGETSIRRNIRPGAQPASLFDIPRDYTVSRVPSLMDMQSGKGSMGGLLEMLGGKAPANSGDKQQSVQDAMRQFQEAMGGAK